VNSFFLDLYNCLLVLMWRQTILSSMACNWSERKRQGRISEALT
jgi:hypothetical protein